MDAPRMPQFFINSENIDHEKILITDTSDIRHITNVLRLKIGNMLVLSDQIQFVYETKILAIHTDCIETQIVNKEESNKKLKLDVTLAQSVLKGQKQDFVIQKATELGVNRIIPFISKNTVVKIASEKDNIQKCQRWQKIADEAAKQCERLKLPEVVPITTLKNVLELSSYDLKIACLERETSSLKKTLENSSDAKSILVIVGPEGGFDKTEIELFKSQNIPTVSLGNLILRAETAVITILSDIIYEYEL